MNRQLVRLLLETGLIQFGRFNHNAETLPFRFNLEMLPAYPDVLRAMVSDAKPLLTGMRANSLLCTYDALPLGVGLSVETDIPLIYSRGSSEAAVYDLIGAYAIGHPTVLLTNVFADFDHIARLMAGAKQVGLEVHSILAIINLGIVSIPQNVRVVELLQLPNLTNELALSGDLPRSQAQTIVQWIKSHMEL